MQIIKRKDAKSLGLKRYFNGKACPHGHVGERLVSNGSCVVCAAGKWLAYRAENPDKIKSLAAAYRANNGEKRKAALAKWYLANKEMVAKAKADWYKNNTAQARAIAAKFRTENRAKSRAMSSAWAAANPEKVKANLAKWRSANPDRNRIYRQNRRALKQANGGTLSHGLAEKLFRLQRGKCACCSKPLGKNYHMDHVMPLSLGGPNIDNNIQLLRQFCNIQKHARHPVDFMQSRGFLI